MKKVLLFLFLIGMINVGCKKDSPNEYQTDEYSEGILGHWKYDQIRTITTTTNYIIDPVFGSMTSEIISNSDTTINYPRIQNPIFPGGVPVSYNYDYYFTYRYDNSYWFDRFCIDEENMFIDYGWRNIIDWENIDNINYSINGEFLNQNLNQDYTNYRISSMSETTMRLLHENRDSISISSNEYQIISTSETKTLLRVEELPLPIE